MIVTFTKSYCECCHKVRNHECMVDLGKCVVCENVTNITAIDLIEVVDVIDGPLPEVE